MSIGVYAHFQREKAHEVDGSSLTWWNRAASMVSAYSEVGAGSVLVREDNADEYFVWALWTPMTVVTPAETVQVKAGSLVIVPPGRSELRFAEAGKVWRGFTTLSPDLQFIAPNAAVDYPQHPAGVAPVDAWPMPVGGYKVRVYDLDALEPKQQRCYRHRTSLTNFPWPIARVSRDVTALSPHTHDDFEQVSIVHSGTMVHHMRRAWGRNMNEWVPDEHVILTAPAVAISKPPDVHTTRGVSAGEEVGLIDFFSPPRWDFSSIPGMVVNADEYPMPEEEPPNYANVVTIYAADDKRAALNTMTKAKPV